MGVDLERQREAVHPFTKASVTSNSYVPAMNVARRVHHAAFFLVQVQLLVPLIHEIINYDFTTGAV